MRPVRSCPQPYAGRLQSGAGSARGVVRVRRSQCWTLLGRQGIQGEAIVLICPGTRITRRLRALLKRNATLREVSGLFSLDRDWSSVASCCRESRVLVGEHSSNVAMVCVRNTSSSRIRLADPDGSGYRSSAWASSRVAILTRSTHDNIDAKNLALNTSIHVESVRKGDECHDSVDRL